MKFGSVIYQLSALIQKIIYYYRIDFRLRLSKPVAQGFKLVSCLSIVQ